MESKYDGRLIDTCIVSQWFGENPLVVERAERLNDGLPLFISEITIGEIEFGHSYASRVLKRTEAVKQADFLRWIEEHFGQNRLPVLRDTGGYYGRFKAELLGKYPPKGKKNRRPEACFDPRTGAELGIDENDLWLASQACNHNLIFVTADNMTKIQDIIGDEVAFEVWPIQEAP